MSTIAPEKIEFISMDPRDWVSTSSFENLPRMASLNKELSYESAISEYEKTKDFILEYGATLREIHNLDVSYVEIPLEKEAILSWFNQKTNTLRSITVIDDEDGFEIYLSSSENDNTVPSKIFKSLQEFRCEI